MRLNNMIFKIFTFVALLVFSAGCRSGGNNGKYWEGDRATRNIKGSKSSTIYQPERVTRPPPSRISTRSHPSFQVQTDPSSKLQNSSSTGLASLPGAYRLKPNDALLITLSGPVERQLEDILDEEGNLNLTYIGEVHAAGKTSTQLEREIERLYIDRKIYRQISVNVMVPTKFYFIRGYVRIPNRYPLIGRITLMQAIAAAGGFNEFANPKKITLTRGNQTEVINFNAIQKTPSLDIELVPGDSLFVPRRIF